MKIFLKSNEFLFMCDENAAGCGRGDNTFVQRQSFCVSVTSRNFSLPYSNRVSGTMVDVSSSSAANNGDCCKPVFCDMNNLISDEFSFFLNRKK